MSKINRPALTRLLIDVGLWASGLGLALWLLYSGALQAFGLIAAQADLYPDFRHSVVVVEGQLGGATTTVAVQGDRAYVGVGPRLLILDVSAPASPTVVGQTAPLAGITVDLVVSGDLVYRAERSVLQIIDVSDPLSPTVVGHYEPPGYFNYLYGVKVVGPYAYVAAGSAGLRILDVSNPVAPIEIGVYDPWDSGSAQDVEIVGDLAYLADWTHGTRIINIADPTAPFLVGAYMTPIYALRISVVGKYAYVVEQHIGVRILDVSDPASPVSAGFYDPPGLAVDVFAMEDRLWVSEYSNGLRLIDVSDPATPTELGSVPLPSGHRLTVEGPYVYAATFGHGLRIVEATIPTAPQEVGAYQVLGDTYQVEGQGDYAYVTDRSGMSIFNVQQPISLTRVGFYDTSIASASLVMTGSLLHMSAPARSSPPYYVGMDIIEVDDPGSLVEVGHYSFPSMMTSMAIAGDFVYLTSFYSLMAIDITDPMVPITAAVFSHPDVQNLSALAVDGPYAYVGTGRPTHPTSFNDLSILDIRDPYSPTLVGFSRSSFARVVTAIAVAGNYAYLARCTDGLEIYDVGDPLSPTLTSRYYPVSDLGYPCLTDVVAVDGYVYAIAKTNTHYTLQIIDVHNPHDPFAAGFKLLPSEGGDLVVVGKRVFLADGNGGLYVLRFIPSQMYFPAMQR